jgi:uncharacterized membrane protein YuzA (DUF378 family)
MKMFHMVTYSLAIVGALNWGLVGLGMLMGGANWNLVHMLLGSMPMVENLVYVVVGASAVYDFAMHMGYCKICGSKKK